MAGSPHDYDENGNLKLPAWYGRSNLAMLFVFMLMAAMGASMRLAKRDYNRTTEGNWILAGALTSQSVQFKVRLNANYGQRFLVSKEPIEEYQEGSPSYLMDAPLESLFTQPDPTQEFLLYGLEPSRKYYYARIAPNFDMLYQGSVQTAPPASVRSNFTLVATGSAFTGSQNKIFEEMAKENPLFFLHLGNMHYGDVDGDLGKRMRFIDQVLGSTTQEQLYTRAAFSYMWNDRDYLGENTLGDEPGREAAMKSFEAAIPSHQPPGAPLYQAYTIGTVRFIVSDLRSEVTEDSIMSDVQREWLKMELSKAGDYDFVIWVTPSTWMGDDLTQHDWTGRPADRIEISEFISALPSQNVLALSAGTEMFAFDDGSHTAYGDFSPSETVLSFPLLMSGPADRLGQIVDARYSEGCSTWLYERNHIYSVIEFKENEETLEPCLHIRSYRVTDVTGTKELLLEKDLCGAIFSPMNKDPESGSCQAERFSANVELMATTALALLAANVVLGFCVGDGFISGVIMMVMTLLGVIATSAVLRYMPSFSYNVDQYESFVVALILNIQLGMEFIFFLCWAKFHHVTRARDRKQRQDTDADFKKVNNWVEPDVENNHFDGARETGTQDEEDEEEASDQFPETNDVYMAPVLVNSPASGKSKRSTGSLSLGKSKSVPSRLTQRPSLHEGAHSHVFPTSESSVGGRSILSGGTQRLAKAKSVPSHLSQRPRPTELVPEQNFQVHPPERSDLSGGTQGLAEAKSVPSHLSQRPQPTEFVPEKNYQVRPVSQSRSGAPRLEDSSSRSQRPRQMEPMPEKKIQGRPASRNLSAPRQKRESSLLALAALIQENAMRTSNSRRGTDPEPCQVVSSKVTSALTGPADTMGDASFQSTFETEEESMRHDPGIDPSFDDETYGLGDTGADVALEESPENDTHSDTTSDETFDENVITESRVFLEPEDCPSGNEAESESEASDIENVSEGENAITECRVEPEESSSLNEEGTESESSGDISADDENGIAESRVFLDPEDCPSGNEAETESEASVIENLSEDESAITECRVEPEDCSSCNSARSGNEASLVEMFVDDEPSDDSEESAVESESSEDSTFKGMLNTREAPTTLASEHDNNGMSDGDEEASAVDDAANPAIDHESLVDQTLAADEDHQDHLDGPRDPDKEMICFENDTEVEVNVDRSEPAAITDDEVSGLLEETLDDAELADGESSVEIHLESASDETSYGDVERDALLTPSLAVVSAAVTPGKADNDTDEATMSGDEESDVEPFFKSEEMEITFLASDSAEEDSTSDNNSEESFKDHIRNHLSPFPESPRRIAVDP